MHACDASSVALAVMRREPCGDNPIAAAEERPVASIARFHGVDLLEALRKIRFVDFEVHDEVGNTKKILIRTLNPAGFVRPEFDRGQRRMVRQTDRKLSFNVSRCRIDFYQTKGSIENRAVALCGTTTSADLLRTGRSRR